MMSCLLIMWAEPIALVNLMLFPDPGLKSVTTKWVEPTALHPQSTFWGGWQILKKVSRQLLFVFFTGMPFRMKNRYNDNQLFPFHHFVNNQIWKYVNFFFMKRLFRTG